MSGESMFIIEDGVLKGVDRDHWRESELIVPEGVTCIGRNAFIGCHYVHRIVLPIGSYSGTVTEHRRIEESMEISAE